MPNSPLSSKIDFPTAKVQVSGKAIKESYELHSISCTQEIGRIPMAEIVLLDGDPSVQNFEISESADFLPGKEISIALGYHSQDEVVFKGIVLSQKIKVRSSGAGVRSYITIKCASEVIKMTVSKKTARFEKKKDSDIISSLLGDNGLEKSVDATTFINPQMVQYNLSDWDFINLRAEANGLIVICKDKKVTVASPEMTGSSKLTLTYGLDVIDFAGELTAEDQVSTINTNSWDPSTQKVISESSSEPSVNAQGNVTGKKLSDTWSITSHEYNTAGIEAKENLKAWGKGMILRSRLSRIKGKVGIPGNSSVSCGDLITLAGFGQRFNGDAYVSRVDHYLEQGKWKTNLFFGLESEPYATKKEVNMPPSSGLIGAMSGLHTGVVLKITEDPDNEFRVLVEIPLLADKGKGLWARLSNFYSTNGKGIFFYPEIGDEVVLGFLNDDARYPIILGSMYSSKIKAPLTPDDKNTIKSIETKESLKMEFNDDKKIITIETPGGNSVTIDDDQKQISIVDQNGNKGVFSSDGISLDSGKDIKIKASGKISIEGTTGVDIKASGGDVGATGNNVNIKANIALTAQGSASAALKASGQVEVKGAMVMIN